MYRLLLIDDEVLTRENIISRLPWKELNIESIKEADDGQNALDIIQSGFKPEIILTDLRMPNMDGVELAFQVKELLPDSKIIFMSGFSDVEYLKSAIELHVINYVEKPLDHDELIHAVQNAVKEYEKDLNSRLYEQTFSKSIPFIKNEIALQLINDRLDNKLMESWLTLTDLRLPQNSTARTLIIKIVKKDSMREKENSNILNRVENRLSFLFDINGLTGVSAVKDDEHLIVHLLSGTEGRDVLSQQKIENLCSRISDLLTEFTDTFFISLGRMVSNIDQISQSYNTAETSLKQAFFYGYKSVVQYKDRAFSHISFKEETMNDFIRDLSRADKNHSIEFIKNIAPQVRCYDISKIKQIQDIYYNIIIHIFRNAIDLGMKFFIDNENHIWEEISKFHTLQEYEDYTILTIGLFFSQLEDRKSGKGIIFDIIRFIHKNYHDNKLSIKGISNHTYMNVNYLCFLFKKETGKTINQFITEHRVEKASELLKDKKFTVSEIAGKVGYKDGNYFAKIFKKNCGYSPSEFRDKYHE